MRCNRGRPNLVPSIQRFVFIWVNNSKVQIQDQRDGGQLGMGPLTETWVLGSPVMDLAVFLPLYITLKRCLLDPIPRHSSFHFEYYKTQDAPLKIASTITLLSHLFFHVVAPNNATLYIHLFSIRELPPSACLVFYLKIAFEPKVIIEFFLNKCTFKLKQTFTKSFVSLDIKIDFWRQGNNKSYLISLLSFVVII